MTARLQLEGIQKSFGPTRALAGVSLELQPGEVLALIGENGAGKSTLMKVLSGAHRADAGSMKLDGAVYSPSGPQEARRAGVAMIYQELNIAPHLTVSENIALGNEPARGGWIDARERDRRARAALSQLDPIGIPLDALAGSLSLAQQQLVEIARALYNEPRVLVLDEPTSSLTQEDSSRLLKQVLKLRERGLGIIYISHFLEECQQVADRFVVLRDGASVGGGVMKETSLEAIIAMMVGRELDEIYPRLAHEIGEPVLELREVSAQNGRPRGAALTLRRGEILGIFGLVGAGRTELLRLVYGLDAAASGTVRLGSREATLLRAGRPQQRLGAGIGFVSENRKEEGLMLSQSIANNMTLPRLEKVAFCGWVKDEEQNRTAHGWMQKIGVKATGPTQLIGALSGGNQQKVAIARLLYCDSEILLLDEPTRGIDIGSKAQIYSLIQELAARGKAVLFVSSHLPELLGVCDTLAVMRGGQLGPARAVTGWSQEVVMSEAITPVSQP